MKPLSVEVTKVVKESERVTTLYFDKNFSFNPGQFAMIWVRGVDEVPMALSSKSSITVERVGDATEHLSEITAGETLGVRAPLGKGFNLYSGENRDLLIVGGGVGVAPLAPLAELAKAHGRRVKSLIGARRREDLIFRDRFERAGDLKLSTDDGTIGHHGSVTDLFKEEDLDRFDRIYVCGPEPMMARCLSILREENLAMRSEFSLNRYFKCGIGICGSCCIDPEGLRVCRDGPVFSGDRLIGSEFGLYRRDQCGIKRGI